MSLGSAVQNGIIANGVNTSRFPDHCSAIGAQRLIDRIAAYWACKGITPPKMWLQKISETGKLYGGRDDGSRIFCVRSDMVDGRPV